MANMTTSIIMELVDRVTRPVRRIQQSLEGLSRRAGLDRLAGSARRVGNALDGAFERAKGFGERMLWMNGIAVGAVWGFERLVSGVTDVGTELQQTAGRLQVGAGWLQEWQYAGRQFGVQNDALADGIKELSLRADEFIMTAGGPAAEAFGRLGIGPEQLRETKGNTEALFDLVTDRLQRIQNDAARQRIFDEIFGGQGGEQLVEMLSRSREELDAIIQRGRQSGAFLTQDEIENSREYNREMGNLRGSLFAIQRTVVGDLLPAITDWIERMRELATVNREAISQRVIDGLRDFWEGLQTAGRVVSWLADRVGGFGNLLLVVIGLLSIGFVAAIGSAILALSNMSYTLLTTPFGWFLLMVAAIAGAAYLIYRNWDDIAGFFGDLWRDVTDAFDAGIGGVMRLLMDWSPLGLLYRGITAALEALGVDVPARFEALGGVIIDGLLGGLGNAWSAVSGWLREKAAALGSAFDGVSLIGIARGLLDGLLGGLVNAWSAVSSWLGGRADAVGSAFDGVSLTDIGSQWIESLKSGIESQWQDLTGWLSRKLDGLTSWLPDWARDGLGIGGVAAPAVPASPAAALGAPVADGRQAAIPAATRADIGGELRIVVDSEGRPRVTEARQNGGLGFNVEAGMLGMMP